MFYIHKQPPELFSEKGVRNNFAKFTGKYQCWSLLFNFSKSLQHRYFLLNFAKFFKNLFYRTPPVVASALFLRVMIIYFKINSPVRLRSLGPYFQ